MSVVELHELPAQPRLDWRLLVLVAVGAVSGIALWAALCLTGFAAILKTRQRP